MPLHVQYVVMALQEKQKSLQRVLFLDRFIVLEYEKLSKKGQFVVITSHFPPVAL